MRIVESAQPAWTEAAAWRIDSVPVLDIGSDIGSTAGDSALVLFDVGGIAPLRDGRLAVVNGGDHQVLIFDATGQLERRIGRRGDGPGDLARPRDVARCGSDTLVVNDVTRLSVFAADGRFLRESKLVPAGDDGALRFAGVAPDCGALLLLARSDRLPAAGEVGVAPVSLFWTRAPGERRDSLGTFAARRVVRRNLGRGGDHGIPMPWSGVTRWAAAGELAYVALPDSAEVQVYGLDGRLRALLRWTPPERGVGDDDRGLYDARREPVLRIAPVAAQIVPPLSEFPELPRAKPPHLGVLADDAGRVWLREYPDWLAGRPDLYERGGQLYDLDAEPASGETWQILDGDGAWLGAVRMPPRLAVSAIADGRVVGVWRDDDGVERVRAYRIIAPDASP